MTAYFICHNRITDPALMTEYIGKAIASLQPYEHEITIFDENTTVLEGECPHPRTVMIKFTSRERAEHWYNSPEYCAIRQMRLDATEGFGVMVNGFAP